MERRLRILMLAPHASEPAMDGGTLRSVAFRDAFRRAGFRVSWLGRYQTDIPGYLNLSFRRRKPEAAIRALLLRSHYVREGGVGPQWRAALEDALQEGTRDVVVWTNFVWSVAELQRASLSPRALYIDTHNSEREWFENISVRTSNPLVRLVAEHSINFSERLTRELPAGTTLVHVSAKDASYYGQLAPQCRHVIVPNGCSRRSVRTQPRRRGPPRLYFLGSLGVQMNCDALSHFGRYFWPVLRNRCEFSVFGSNPSARARGLCSKHGWTLSSNLTDVELDKQLSDFDGSVLPFDYSAGSKLKLVDALMRGMQVLTTPEGVAGAELPLPRSVLISKVPSEWLIAVQKLVSIRPEETSESLNYAQRFTWECIIKEYLSGPQAPDFISY